MDLTDFEDSCEWHEPGLPDVQVQAVPSSFQTRPSQPGQADSPALTLSALTTFKVGGPVRRHEKVNGPEEFAEAVRTADEEGLEVLVVGGGSNLLPADDAFDGIVIQDVSTGVQVQADGSCGGAIVSAPAGQPWDEFVATCINNDQMGLESLSGIPGTVGAAPVQNIGAYGHEVAETLFQVKVYDRALKGIRVLPAPKLELSYRNSLIKRSFHDSQVGGGRTWGPTGRYVVLSAEFQLIHASKSAPIKYGQLAERLGVQVGDRVDLRVLREAVLDLRRSKGMILDPADADSHSAGSFFTNPIISEEAAVTLPEEAPKFHVEQTRLINPVTWQAPEVKGQIKTSAAWLIQHSGITPGFHLPGQPQSAVSSKHVLALTNRGGASAAQIAALARHIQQRVQDTFGVWLEPEPVFVGKP